MANHGKIKWFNDAKGFGFIETDEGRDIFLHHSDIQNDKVIYIEEGLPVLFNIEDSPAGPFARQVVLQEQEG